MKRMSQFTIAAAMMLAAMNASGAETAPKVPILLELFTSEGCSSCPPADKLLEEFDRTQPFAGADLIVLSEHVDYWNRLGWSDPWSSAAYSERQRQYGDKFKLESVYTPQLVVDGHVEVVGNNPGQAKAAIQKSLKQPKQALRLTSSRSGKQVQVQVELDAGASQGDVYVALAENSTQSQVMRGENAGRVLNHVAVVRSLVPAGTVSRDQPFSKQLTVPVPKGGTKGWRVVAFVQDAESKQVLAVAQQHL